MGMFRITLIALILMSPLHAATITYAEAGKHVGQEVTVTGKVSGVRTIPSGMTFLNFGKRGAEDAFTAVAKPGVVDGDTLSAFDGKDVEVTGTVELYRGSPQIVLATPESIRLSGETPAPQPAGPPEKPASHPEKPAPAAFGIEPYDVAMDKKDVRLAGKSPSGFIPQTAKAVIALPSDFKPAETQRVLVVVPDFVSEADLEKLTRQHAEVAAPKGWVTVIANCPSPDEFGTDGLYAAAIQAAMRHLAEQHAGADDWPLYLAGNSLGAGRATLASGALIKEGFDVRGVFLSSLKREDITKSMRVFRPSKSVVRKLRVFVSHGERDTHVSKAQSLEQAEAVRQAGVKEVRHEIHSGRGGMDAAALAKALDWFAEPEAGGD
jgi:hypothetical protein